MRGLMLETPEALLDERRRSGADHRDEVWDGVLHMPPQPTGEHQFVVSRLILALTPLAESVGRVVVGELAMLDPARGETNYRVPDVVVVDYAQISARGIEGDRLALMAIEILSPNDESREKLPFYAARGVSEAWLLEPNSRTVEVFVLRGGVFFAALPDARGIVRAPALGIELETVAGPRLRIGTTLV